MTKTALPVILLGSTLLFSAAYSIAAGQAASPTPAVPWPTKDRSNGTPASVGVDEQTSPSTAVAEAETLYADLADSYGVIPTIDSGLFATYQGKDRAAWERVYEEKRKQLVEKLSKISPSGLSPIDARALEVMNRHLRDDFPEQFRDENAPPEYCQDAQRQDLSMASLEGALHSCFTELGNNVEFEGSTSPASLPLACWKKSTKRSGARNSSTRWSRSGMPWTASIMLQAPTAA